MRTWHDAVQQVLETVGGQKSGGRNIVQAKLSVQQAIQQLVTERDWRYYYSPHRILTSAQYDTGTIAYDHTGGSSERLVTLSSGTWPTWAEYGTLLIDSVPYEVHTRVDDTTLTLTEAKNPQADVASGTSYTLYRESYTLPEGYESLVRVDRLNDWDGCYLPPDQFQAMRESLEFSGQPRYFTVMADQKDPSRLAFWLYPGPQSQETFDFLFKRRPVSLRVYDYSTSTVTVSVGMRSVTGANSVFTSDMAGAVIRFGAASSKPERLEATENQYDHEAVIDSVESATGLTLKTNAAKASSGVAYRISSRLDVADGAMWLALMDLAVWRYMRNTMQSASQTKEAASAYAESLRAAARQDQHSPAVGSSNSIGPYDAARMFPQISFS